MIVPEGRGDVSLCINRLRAPSARRAIRGTSAKGYDASDVPSKVGTCAKGPDCNSYDVFFFGAE